MSKCVREGNTPKVKAPAKLDNIGAVTQGDTEPQGHVWQPREGHVWTQRRQCRHATKLGISV